MVSESDPSREKEGVQPLSDKIPRLFLVNVTLEVTRCENMSQIIYFSCLTRNLDI